MNVFTTYIFILVGKYLGRELLGYRINNFKTSNFPKWLNKITYHQQCTRVQINPDPHLVLLTFSHWRGCKMHVIVVLVPLMTNNIKQLFMCLWGINTSLCMMWLLPSFIFQLLTLRAFSVLLLYVLLSNMCVYFVLLSVLPWVFWTMSSDKQGYFILVKPNLTGDFDDIRNLW